MKRFGANPPDEIREVHSRVLSELLAAAGIPIELMIKSDGAGMRESWRRFTAATISPLGRLIEAEATAKLVGDPVEIDFHRLRGSDVQGLARAVKSLVDSGQSIEQALEIVGRVLVAYSTVD